MRGDPWRKHVGMRGDIMASTSPLSIIELSVVSGRLSTVTPAGISKSTRSFLPRSSGLCLAPELFFLRSPHIILNKRPLQSCVLHFCALTHFPWDVQAV